MAKRKRRTPQKEPPTAAAVMGRPALYHKPFAKTFMLSAEASGILDRKALELKCSRSDALETAIRYFGAQR